MTVKSAYVDGARAVRSVLATTGALPALDRWAQASRTGTWARSLLSIHDVDELVALDVPWWTFDAAALVDAFLAGRRSARVFEWGSGASTVWLARRAASVVAVEHDEQWAGRVRALLDGHPTGVRANVEVRTIVPTPATGAPGEVRSVKPGATGADFQRYVAVVDEVGGAFDLIVVDGRARAACLARALPHLAADGVLVVDNVERRRYREAIADLAPTLALTWTRGITPGLPYPTRTALLRPRPTR